MPDRRNSFARGAQALPRSSTGHRRQLMNLGLLGGCALLGSLAAALWIHMVF